MKNLSILICLGLIVAVLFLFMFSFQVRETESALVTFFGEPLKTITEPGWYWKWPKPINVVHPFDSRNHLYEGIMEETTTKGGEPIIVTSYVIWSIKDPLKFRESVQDKTGAEEKLRGLLRDTQNSIIGRHYFSEFINADPDKIKFREIEQEMLDSVTEHAGQNYGINVKMVGIKQLGIDEEVTKDVFERMKADRQRKTEAILSQGEAEATKIKTQAEKKKKELLAYVETQAIEIRGEGDAMAAEYYKLLEEDPELAMFLRDIEALQKILEEKSTIVLGADTAPIKYLKGMPDISPK